MKNIIHLEKDLGNFTKKLINNLMRTQEVTADKIYNDVMKRAPSSSGEYSNSIKKSETIIENDTIKTKIYTDLKSEEGYLIGRMIENGTGIYALEPHIGHTKTFFNSGYQYWFVPVKSTKRAIGRKIVINGFEFYIAKAQKPKPHFKPALDENISFYKESIKKVIKEAK